MRVCEFAGCDRPHKAKGLCAGHDSQSRSGRELVALRPKLRMEDAPWTVETMTAASEPQGDCLVFGKYQSQKYAFVWVDQEVGRKRQILAHRHMYWLVTGENIEGMTIHHTCANARCINPDHLQPASKAENTLEMLARKDYEAEIARLQLRIVELEAQLEGVHCG